jgi:hypothetical protein
MQVPHNTPAVPAPPPVEPPPRVPVYLLQFAFMLKNEKKARNKQKAKKKKPLSHISFLFQWTREQIMEHLLQQGHSQSLVQAILQKVTSSSSYEPNEP